MSGFLRGNSIGRVAVWLCALCAVLACDRGPEPLGERLSEVKQLFETTCSRCHSIEIPLNRRKSWAGWKATVNRMRQRGASLTPEEAEDIARYLALIRGR